MNERVKELLIKKIKINPKRLLNRNKFELIVFLYSEDRMKAISNKNKENLFIDELLIKIKNSKKNLLKN
ncbi:MAG: hypothetical protein CBC22_03125 [Alphaproteobacteria bacterium TMED62]|nr:MAG: hypothetical protein CBC22_03125 [Alphaproteobacteria bacterium TMED62]|tara:strand:+ start:50 stop:256 length:207 start_codon:yes stop_codon:yes gene_type:complete